MRSWLKARIQRLEQSCELSEPVPPILFDFADLGDGRVRVLERPYSDDFAPFIIAPGDIPRAGEFYHSTIPVRIDQ